MTLALSAFSYSYYENWYRRLSQPRVFLLFAGLALLNGWLFLAFLKCPVVSRAINSYYYSQGELDPPGLRQVNYSTSKYEGSSQNERGIRQKAGARPPWYMEPLQPLNSPIVRSSFWDLGLSGLRTG